MLCASVIPAFMDACAVGCQNALERVYACQCSAHTIAFRLVMHMVEAMRVTADKTLHEPGSVFWSPLPPGLSSPPPRIRSPVGVRFGVVSNGLIQVRYRTAVCKSACLPVGKAMALVMRHLTFCITRAMAVDTAPAIHFPVHEACRK